MMAVVTLQRRVQHFTVQNVEGAFASAVLVLVQQHQEALALGAQHSALMANVTVLGGVRRLAVHADHYLVLHFGSARGDRMHNLFAGVFFPSVGSLLLLSLGHDCW